MCGWRRGRTGRSRWSMRCARYSTQHCQLLPKSDMAKAIFYGDGPRCVAFSMTGAWSSITTSLNARCAALPSDGETGYSPVRRRAASAPRLSTTVIQTSKVNGVDPQAYIANVTGKLQLIGRPRDGTNSCLELGSTACEAGSASCIVRGLPAMLTMVLTKRR